MIEFFKNIYRWLRVWVIRFFALFSSKMKMGDFLSPILILAPHPDDEIFGCAGLIQRSLLEEKEVFVVILSGGEGAYEKSLIEKDELKVKRKQLTLNAALTIGMPHENIFFLDWRDGRIGDDAKIYIDELDRIIERVKPSAIFSPHPFEGWQDHIAASKLADEIINSHNSHIIRNYKYCVWLWYSMPYSKLFRLNWKTARLLRMNTKEYSNKQNAVNKYIEPLTPFGKSYSGDLPKLFVRANRWSKELYFESNL
jgi:Uncharacterized proteins, LmbE homologs